MYRLRGSTRLDVALNYLTTKTLNIHRDIEQPRPPHQSLRGEK